jgi:glycopeptide antibiotics resistance protein
MAAVVSNLACLNISRNMNVINSDPKSAHHYSHIELMLMIYCTYIFEIELFALNYGPKLVTNPNRHLINQSLHILSESFNHTNPSMRPISS